MDLRVAGIIPESVVDGPGLRTVVFAQGCPRFCPGCHNPDTIDPAGGTMMSPDEIMSVVEKNPLIRGVTFSGGDPFLQAAAFEGLGSRVKAKGLNLMTYTGYTWEELQAMGRRDPAVAGLLQITDYLVDGPFIAAQKDLNLPYRGSRNQRIIDVRASLANKNIALAHFS